MKAINRNVCLAFLSALPFLFPHCGHDAPGGFRIQVQSVAGSVKVLSRSRAIVPVRGDFLNDNDEISTGKASSLDLLIGDDVIMRIRENSRVELSSLLAAMKRESRISLLSGKAFVIITKLKRGSTFTINTPTTTIAVRGTVFRVHADDKKLSVDVLGGVVSIHPLKEGQAVMSVAETLGAGRHAEITTKESLLIAEGKSSVRTRAITADEFVSAIAELNEITKEVLVNLEPALKERFEKEADLVIRERANREKKALEGERIRAYREAEELRKKAEAEEARKKQEEEAAAAARKKLAEDRARAQKAAQQKKKVDRSGDVTGIK